MMNRFASAVAAGLLSAGLLAADPEPAAPRKKASAFFESLFRRNPPAQDSAETGLAQLTPAQLTGGLKEAMEKGLVSAVKSLGRTNGFLTNMNVRIRVPEQLKTVETTLRTLRQDALVDEFEATLNRAAEKAVPAGTEVLLSSLKKMTVNDAANLVTSKSPTAITEYFRGASAIELSQKFLPIVQEATAQTGVTSAYKQLLAKTTVGGFSFLPRSTFDLDQYVTDRTLDGLFLEIGNEEKKIRENPQARTTELLQKVFGALKN